MKPTDPLPRPRNRSTRDRGISSDRQDLFLPVAFAAPATRASAALGCTGLVGCGGSAISVICNICACGYRLLGVPCFVDKSCTLTMAPVLPGYVGLASGGRPPETVAKVGSGPQIPLCALTGGSRIPAAFRKRPLSQRLHTIGKCHDRTYLSGRHTLACKSSGGSWIGSDPCIAQRQDRCLCPQAQ
jgi:hypothetical protein